MKDAPNFPFSRQCPMHQPAEYAALRSKEPVSKVRLWNGKEAWIVTRYDLVRELLANPHVSASPETSGYPVISPARGGQLTGYGGKTMVIMDPPEHTRMRRMLTREFMVKRISALRPKVEDAFEALIRDLLAGPRPADLIEALALPLPSLVISMMLGVPYEEREPLQEWSRQKVDFSLAPSVAAAASQSMFDYLRDFIRKRMKNPDDTDLVGRLVVERIQPGDLSLEEAAFMLSHLYLAGHETTANQIGLGVLSLLDSDEERQKLARDPTLAAQASEEMLRLHSIVHFNSARVATQDIEVGGHLIRKGDGFYALIAAANHDPAVFDKPECLRIDRSAESHLAFSYGIHQCLGQPLARLELEVVFSRLFQRLPQLELAVSREELRFKEDGLVYGLHSLPVDF